MSIRSTSQQHSFSRPACKISYNNFSKHLFKQIARLLKNPATHSLHFINLRCSISTTWAENVKWTLEVTPPWPHCCDMKIYGSVCVLKVKNETCGVRMPCRSVWLLRSAPKGLISLCQSVYILYMLPFFEQQFIFPPMRIELFLRDVCKFFFSIHLQQQHMRYNQEEDLPALPFCLSHTIH